ncbi:MAG: peptidoglycan-binding protein [Alphaproteobacteria bacterium]|nr:peptidoglycan-binding protein [Alphaproteobacteria bacterium]
MSLIYTDNDPLAPAGQQRGRAFSPGDILRSQLEPVAPRPGKDTPNEGWFSLGSPVGPHPAPNRRPDVLRVETLLGRAGDYDIGRTDGPTGWWGSRAEGAVRTYQKRKGLKVDGLLNPGGPTIASLEGELADAFKGFSVPSLSEIDAHHDALKLGEPGLLTHKPPPLDITPPEGVAEGTQAANRRTAQFLLGRSSDDGLDQFVARDIQDNGEAGILRNRDLILQIKALDPKRAHSFAWGIISHLPRETARDFLGGEVPNVPPVGIRKEDWRRTLEVRKDDPDPAPRAEPYYPEKDTGNHRMLLNDAGEGTGEGSGDTGNDANEAASSQPPENSDGASNQPRANDQGATPATQNAGGNEKSKEPAPISPEFLDAIWSAEQGNRKPEQRTTNEVNSGSTEKGKYQINDQGLVGIGWKDDKGNWTDLAKRNGVKSDADFKNDSSAQDKAAHQFFKRKEDAVRKEADAHRGQEIDGVVGKFKITDAGLVAAAHRDGEGVVKDYLSHQKKNGWKSDFSNIDSDVAKRRDIKDSMGNVTRSTEDRFRAVETRIRKFENIPYRK